jgi:hypothetical protein
VSDAAPYAPPTVPAFTPPPVTPPQPAPRPSTYAPPIESQPASAYVPPQAPIYTPPIQPQPAAQVPYATTQYAPSPQYAAPAYTPPPVEYASSNPADDKRRTVLIGLGCLGLLLVVMLVAFVAWSFIDCQSFSSVFPFLFPPFSCT